MRNIDPLQETPSVSVVIPAYNAEATLAETLRSVEAQTFQDFDLTIVDDGSTDETPKIAKAFCADHSWAHYLRQDNQGVAKARNSGASASSGTYIAPLDADDLWSPNYLEEMVETVRGAQTRPVLVYAFSKGPIYLASHFAIASFG